VTPTATMRLQLHAGFTFAEAIGIAPYLSGLGISHVYASPITTARVGSTHGYDVIDPTRVNPELGGEAGLRQLVGELRRLGLGLIADIVPNHMYVGDGANPWWEDVLANGQASRWAKVFDIDWQVEDPGLRGKVLLPILGAPYGEVLARGDLKLIEISTGFVIECQGRQLPINEQGRAIAASGDSEEDRLRRILDCQHYRLAWWGIAGDEINWRRFFEINELAGVRVEDDEVFELTHALLFDLYAKGLVDGVRIDHIDGLAQPAAYCRKLRERLGSLAARRPPRAPGGDAYIIVEKILAADERLPTDWGVDGTSGYDFMDQVSAVLHDPRGAEPLTRLWSDISDRTASFDEEARSARRELLERSFSSQLEGTVAALHRVARAGPQTQDVSRAALRRTVTQLVTHFPAYRTYASDAGRSPADTERFARAARAAIAGCFPQDRFVIDHLDRWLGGEPVAGADAELRRKARVRFEQLCAPIAAKAVEDTAFYRYGRLLSRTDVGFDVARFALSPDIFHALARERHRHWPAALLATATHDHKRGEDIRARLAVLSEIAEEWSTSVRRWMAMNAHLRTTLGDRVAPMQGDEAILYQMLVGAWPLGLTVDDHAGRVVFCKRLGAWLEKALREAKLVTDWFAPNKENEQGARRFLTKLLASDQPSPSLVEIAAFARRIGPAGAVNGLAQLVLKMTSPGVPDFYQGTEYWDQSLVDPDNRTPVDFAARRATLSEPARLEDMIDGWRDGRIKQSLIRSVLSYRRGKQTLFSAGAYRALNVYGPLSENVVAYERVLGEDQVCIFWCRLPQRLLQGEDSIRIPTEIWRGTHVSLPRAPQSSRWLDILTNKEIRGSRDLKASDLLGSLPVSILSRMD
jgi:(1->4)-alpha-D-glucan 1-alpha-D-glucosylmutase